MEIVLRMWEDSDVESLQKYADNENVAANLRNGFPHPYTLRNAEEFVASCMENEGTQQVIRAIEIDGEAVGSIGVFFQRDVYEKSVELGYWLGEPFWGRGIMCQAVEKICSDIFSTYDIVRIFAEPFAENIGSRRVLEKAGFELEGILKKSVYKNGEFQDSCIYALLR